MERIVLSSLLNDAEVCGNDHKTRHKINYLRPENSFPRNVLVSFPVLIRLTQTTVFITVKWLLQT